MIRSTSAETLITVSNSSVYTILVTTLTNLNIIDIVDSKSEKPARGTLFTAMQRYMNQDTILIVDGLNYIKGFRYQMYCAARELKLRVCTVRLFDTAPIHVIESHYLTLLK